MKSREVRRTYFLSERNIQEFVYHIIKLDPSIVMLA